MTDFHILKLLSLNLWVQNKFHPDYVYFNIFTKIGLHVKTSDLERRKAKRGEIKLYLF